MLIILQREHACQQKLSTIPKWDRAQALVKYEIAGKLSMLNENSAPQAVLKP